MLIGSHVILHRDSSLEHVTCKRSEIFIERSHFIQNYKSNTSILDENKITESTYVRKEYLQDKFDRSNTEEEEVVEHGVDEKQI